MAQVGKKEEIKFYKIETILQATEKNTLYCVKSPTDTEFKLVVTDLNGNIVNLKDLTGGSGGSITLTSNDNSILITGSSTKNLQVSTALQAVISSALQSGDAISSLINDAGYITIADVPTLTSELTNDSGFITTETDPIFSASEASNFVVGDKANLDNQSGTNTGDETTTSIQTKRPLKTVNSQSLEGSGNITINATTNLGYTASPTQGVVTSDTGNDAVIPLEDGINAGLAEPTTNSKAQSAVQPSDLGAVATSNDYNDLDNLPTIPTNTSDLTNDSGFVDVTTDLSEFENNSSDPYIKQSQLPANLNLYATNVASDIGGYVKLVSSIDDTDFNSPAVDIATGSITTTAQLIASLASEQGVLIGNPGLVNITTIGNIRRTSGTGDAQFYFEVYKRNLAGAETLITTSGTTSPITSGTYQEFLTDALLNDGVFLSTDRVVLKFYANRVAGGSDPEYEFQFGGTSPVRTTLPVPSSNLTTMWGNISGDINDQTDLVKAFDYKPVIHSKTTNLPSFGSAAINNIEGNSIIVSGGTARTFDGTNLYTRTQKLGLSVSITGNLAQLRQTSLYFTRESNFEMIFKFGMAENATDTAIRFFQGVCANTGAFSNVEPNTLLNIVGVCRLSTSNNLHLVHNDNSGIATTVDLGVNFPANTTQTDICCVIVRAVSTGIYVEIKRLNTGDTYTTTLTTDIPAINQGLNFGSYIVDTTGVNTATAFDFMGMTLKSD